jgi:hypothetical protein
MDNACVAGRSFRFSVLVRSRREVMVARGCEGYTSPERSADDRPAFRFLVKRIASVAGKAAEVT